MFSDTQLAVQKSVILLELGPVLVLGARCLQRKVALERVGGVLYGSVDETSQAGQAKAPAMALCSFQHPREGC